VHRADVHGAGVRPVYNLHQRSEKGATTVNGDQ
jgi:hypothetical protein